MVPTRIDATYRVTTPMFCGGASGEAADLRLPSFKGVLRYWWRALAWSSYGGDLGRIHQKEEALFGSAKRGQSRVSMRLKSPPAVARRRKGKVLQVPGTNRPIGEGACYLGYGVMEAFGKKAGQLTRSCLDGGFEFTVQMRLPTAGKEGLRREQMALLESALVCVGVFGGLGAKSRKGYGSVAISATTVGGELRAIPRSKLKLRETIADLHRRYASIGRPKYTALSQDARHLLVTSEKQEPLELLNLLGRELKWYRSWGHRGTVFGEESEKIFRDDHDLMKSVGSGPVSTHPRRIAFGLPHNYGRGREVVPQNLDRRASRCSFTFTSAGKDPSPSCRFCPRVSCQGVHASRSGGIPSNRYGRTSCISRSRTFSTGFSTRARDGKASARSRLL